MNFQDVDGNNFKIEKFPVWDALKQVENFLTYVEN